jgi:hypothetical protein
MNSINGILKFKPGVITRVYFPKMVTTATVPCWTMTMERKATTAARKSKTGRKNMVVGRFRNLGQF